MNETQSQPGSSIFSDEREAGRTPSAQVGRPLGSTTPATETPTAAPQPPPTPTPSGPVLVVPPKVRTHWAFYLGLAGVALLSLYLRLLDPLSSTIIGAEDPYLHMERTYQLIHGDGVRDYPIGFMILLAPFALLGPDAFYNAARFGPPVLGMAAVVLTFFLCRPYMHPSGALTASLLLGTIPEHIRRTDLLFPTALDLAILPFFFLVVMKLAEGRRWAVPTLALRCGRAPPAPRTEGRRRHGKHRRGGLRRRSLRRLQAMATDRRVEQHRPAQAHRHRRAA
ncbi:MAG: hypothetical protein HYT80_11800 [Euryarchaeota archaeon]|nr:hypothetical protein [Euryarchaeota archaeon]